MAPVTLEDDALNSLRRSGLLDILAWAAPTAFAATDQIYDENQGHDQGVVGYLNFKHLSDLVDRATANGRFALSDDVDSTGDDVVKAGITPNAFSLMPRVPLNSIVRSDYNQSPGWAVEGYRVLLQSHPFGKVDEIKWAQRSDAKRRVASQPFIGDNTLFDDDDFGLESNWGIPDDDDFVGVTLIAAHAFFPPTKQFELNIGQSKNPEYRGESCWHWRHLLLSGGTPLGGLGLPALPVVPGNGAAIDVEDVHVRIKKPLADEGAGSANG